MQVRSRPIGKTRMVSHRVWARRLRTSVACVAAMFEAAEEQKAVKTSHGKLIMPRVQARPSNSAMRMRRLRARQRECRPPADALAHYNAGDGKQVAMAFGDHRVAGAYAAARGLNVLADLGLVDDPMAALLEAAEKEPDREPSLVAPYDCIPRLEAIIRDLTGAWTVLR